MKKIPSPSLVILAAGIGSRYNRVARSENTEKPKQLDTFGPNGESLMEYSIYDALTVGFKKIVFVITRQLEDLFTTRILKKIAPRNRGKIDYVFQELGDLSKEFDIPESRRKPWGTGHATLCAKDAVEGPFAVINADDFYGRKSFRIMLDALTKIDTKSKEAFMLGFLLSNTLSDFGGVSRGICEIRDRRLSSITEYTKIRDIGGEILTVKDGTNVKLAPDEIVSMNFWGFPPAFFNTLENGFRSFLKENHLSEDKEYYITTPVDFAIKNRLMRVSVIKTDEKWFGVTYPEDKEAVTEKIRRKISSGQYPEKLTDTDGENGN